MMLVLLCPRCEKRKRIERAAELLLKNQAFH
jgi:hypothetical protein